MQELLQNLLTAGPFIPHGHCYLWKPELVWLHLVSDSLIALAYYSIPITLVYFVRKRVDLPFDWIFLLFSTFIVACGTTHLMEVWTLWHPTYWVSGLLKALTALVSLLTAVLLVQLLPKMLAFPSPAQLEAANQELQQQISVRQQAEEALRESEERFRNAFDNAAIGKALVALDGRWLKVNRALCEIAGYCEQEMLATTFQAITHPDDLDIDLDHVSQLLNGEIRYYEIEKRYFHKLGYVVWILLSGSLVRDAEYKPLYFITQIQDITTRKQAEQALRESEERYRAIVEDQTELITRFQPNGTLTFVNEAYCRYFGQAPEEIIGNCYEPFIFQEDHEALAQLLNGLSSENPVGMIEHRVVVAGEIRWMQWINRAIFDDQGQFIEFQSVGRDISDRKQVEEALRLNEALFRSLSESSPIGILRTDAEGKCIYTNHRCQAICGFTFEEALGDGWMQFAHADDLKIFLPQWSQATAVKQEFSGKLRYEHRDSDVRFCQIRTAPIFSVNGEELIGHVGTVEDITETLAIERMKKEFISIVSHELRTPLASMRGSLGLLTTGALDQKPQTAKQMLEIAATETERLVRLVNDILDLERLESHKVELVKQWCDTDTVIRQSVETLQSLAAENHIKVSLSSSKIQIWADPDRIIQTLVNLLNNALKFSPSNSTVMLSVEVQEEWVLFQVKDQGRGIPADKLESIFGRFQQVDASDSRQKGGTGLGLAICRTIVQQHGGRIWVESELRKGSTFCFTLPMILE
jgi:PAS domain S-box-containing protein